jgi:hypothetical protein
MVDRRVHMTLVARRANMALTTHRAVANPNGHGVAATVSNTVPAVATPGKDLSADGHRSHADQKPVHRYPLCIDGVPFLLPCSKEPRWSLGASTQ